MLTGLGAFVFLDGDGNGCIIIKAELVFTIGRDNFLIPLEIEAKGAINLAGFRQFFLMDEILFVGQQRVPPTILALYKLIGAASTLIVRIGQVAFMCADILQIKFQRQTNNNLVFVFLDF